MGDIWSIVLVILGLIALFAGIRLATGAKPWSADSVDPAAPPAGPGAEGMGVVGPGDISPGVPDDHSQSRGEPNA